MLHRSFKPAKCKTSLKLAVSRIKLLKNKRGAQLKQMKRDLAQLLESGQDQTARIRVEHVVREEKTMAAYDLVEVYCEMIAARLPIIESKKNCPIDLKEAITSVIFASPRCADIPELMEIRKHFTAKYGKDFISAAVELRPECGVSSNLVEKLSAKAPDGRTKIKILAAIAEEHNIKWEPKSFEENESKPPEVLLSGPDTFEKASKMQMEPPDVQAPLSHGQKPDVPVNLYEHNVRSSWSSQDMSPYNSQNMPSLSSQNISSTDFGANKATASSSSPPVPRPSGTVNEEMGFRHPYSENVNPLSPGRQNWNMEFKDATAAAQAAAESAERASMAARAAAELSSRERVNTQYSTESQKSSAFDSRDEGPGKFAGSKFQGEHLSKVSANNSFHDRNPRSQNVQMDGNQQDNLEGVSERLYRDGNHRKSSRSSSLKSNSSSIDEVNTGQRSDSYSQRRSSAVEATKLEKDNLFKQSDKSEVGFLGEPQGGMKNENVDYSGNVRIKRESSTLSSRSHSSAFGDAYDEMPNLNSLRSDNDAGENPFAAGTVQGNSQIELEEANSLDNAHVVFDEYGSDDNDVGRKDSEEELNTDFQSPGRKSPTHLSANKSAWSPRQGRSESMEKLSSQSDSFTEWRSPQDFSEGLTKSNSVAPSQPEDLLPVTFDDSDGLSSESEKRLDQPKFSGRTDPSIIHLNENVHARDPEPTQSETQELEGSSFGEKGNSGSNREPWLDSSSDDSDTPVPKRNQRREFKAESQKKFGFSDMSPSQSSPGRLKSIVDQNDLNREPFYNPVDEEKHLQSQRSSRLSFVHEVKDKDDFDTKNLPSIMENTKVGGQSSWESGKELNFETLTGGLRNKGYKRPPYVTQPSCNASSLSEQKADDTPATVQQSLASPTPQHSIASTATQQSPGSPTVTSLASHAVHIQETNNQEARTKVNKKSISRTRPTYFDSETDDSEEELPELPQHSSKKESYNQKAGVKDNTKLSSRGPITYFDMDDDDSEEDVPKPTLTRKGRPTSSFSRRTKASSNFETSSYSKSAVTYESLTASNNSAERKPSSRRSHSTDTMAEARSQTRSSGQQERKLSSQRLYATQSIPESQYQTKSPGPQESSEWHRSSEQATHKPMPEPKTSLEKESSKFPAIEQQSNPVPKTVASGSSESSKTSSSSAEPPSRENSIKKASHVHPKLPDYEALAARFQSLRVNRQ